jgi:hypothetical protein
MNFALAIHGQQRPIKSGMMIFAGWLSAFHIRKEPIGVVDFLYERKKREIIIYRREEVFSREKRDEGRKNTAGTGRKGYCPTQPIETADHCDEKTTGYMQNEFWVKSPCGAVRDEIEFSRGREDPEEKPRTDLFI